MKVIVFGATGFVGNEVVNRCRKDSDITEVFAITRRPLLDDISEDAKVKTILHSNFLEYPQSLLDQISGSECCLWCIGGRHTQISRWKTQEEYAQVSVEYTLAAATAFAESLAPHLDGKPFRFIFCSGHATELDQNKSLWVMGPTRKVKGKAELSLFSLADMHPKVFECFTIRPCGIYQPNPSLKDIFLTSVVLPSLHVEELAITMVDIGKRGFNERIVEHETIKRHGRGLLETST
ncbi:MAG: hypothetical protein M1834_007912 [Cirrosporium novae-zelandiae]|nr:MAG: hypothetical protein M1834_007912 [Cirrosporium novae-zelandiae]